MSDGDRFSAVGKLADAVLYEGYLLYPYRASAGKNQLRWQFGVLVPPAASDSGSERSDSVTECLVRPAAGPGRPRLRVRARFLQIQQRTVEAVSTAGVFEEVPALRVDGEEHVGWDEAVEQVVDLPPWPLPARRAARPVPFEVVRPFEVAGGRVVEPLRDRHGLVVGRIVRTRQPLSGRLQVEASPAPGPGTLLKVRATLANTAIWRSGRGGRMAGTPHPTAAGVPGDGEGTSPGSTSPGNSSAPSPSAARTEYLRHSLVAAHTMLAVEHGRFVSLLDPPAEAREAAAACRSSGCFPVLVDHDDQVVLSSPIILYDHPEVAPESPGDLYDATEIDEILALRVLTLTDEEKAQARATDLRAAEIVDRCEAMPAESWERLHGAIRHLGPSRGPETPRAPSSGSPPGSAERPRRLASGPEPPWDDPGAAPPVDPSAGSLVVRGVKVRRGSKVVLRPSRRADAQDAFFTGMRATVSGVFQDLDGDGQVAVTVDDDPAAEVLSWQGRYLYFHPEEIEPYAGPTDARADETGPFHVEAPDPASREDAPPPTDLPETGAAASRGSRP